MPPKAFLQQGLDTHRREGDTKTEAEIGVLSPRPSAKDCQQPPEAGIDNEWILPQNLQREYGPADTFTSEFWPPELGKNTFYCFKPPSL